MNVDEKNKKIKQLKRNSRFEILNRLFCYACVIPMFHFTACLGQQKPAPMISKVGTIGVVLATVNALRLNKKEDDIKSSIRELPQKYIRGRGY